MTLFTPDQLATALAALGINGNFNTIPTLFAVPKRQNNPAPAQRTGSGPPVSSTAANAPSAGPPATTVNISPAVPANAPHNTSVLQSTQSMTTVPVAGSSFQATIGPDGPWYAIMKGHTKSQVQRHSSAATLTAFNEAVQAGVVKILYVYIPPTLVLPYLPLSNVIPLSAVSFLEESLKWKLDRGNNVSGMRFLYWTILEHGNLEISKSLLSLCTKVNSTLLRGAEWIPMEQHIIKKYTPI
ncbi:hypothetical protein IW262DRAFT_1302981 [Armillaria fumosa]|nr:hypothetical protein IW262DRAFT_1302981 [Armillaria fumosa]